MEPKLKFDFEKHTLPKGSKKYMLKIVIYIAILGFLLTLLYFKKEELETKKSTKVIQEIKHFKLIPKQNK